MFFAIKYKCAVLLLKFTFLMFGFFEPFEIYFTYALTIDSIYCGISVVSKDKLLTMPDILFVRIVLHICIIMIIRTLCLQVKTLQYIL